jgi:hypothetical protein
MIGSRARGTPRPESDLDLVVLIELPVDATPWGPADVIAERTRIQQQLPAPRLRTDLWVRTTDRYAEARTVIGGVERLVDTEGIDVYSRPPTRAPVVRRTPDQVRREHVSAWIEHALAALEGTVRIEARPAGQAALPGEPATPDAAARICLERAVNALLVSDRTEAGKSSGLDGMLARLGEADRRRVAAVLAAADHAGARASARARALIGEVLKRLAEDPAMRTYLVQSEVRYRRVGRG